MENSSDASLDMSELTSGINRIQKKIKKDIKVLADNNGDEILLNTICDNVREMVLDREDDENLSRNHNNCRRIEIASDLCVQLTSVYEEVVTTEYKDMVFEALDYKRLKEMADRIKRIKKRERKFEEYFRKMALSKLIPANINGSENLRIGEEEVLLPPCHVHDNKADHPPSDVHNEPFDRCASALRTEVSQPENVPAISETEKVVTEESNNKEDPSQGLCGSLTLDTNHGSQIGDNEEFQEDMWELPNIKLQNISRKRRKQEGLRVDENIIIDNYAKRAVRLNKKSVAQGRIQVYEGPPRILEVMSVKHLMTSPSVRSFVLPERSSTLNRLYQRHLTTEKRTHQQHSPRHVVEQGHPMENHLTQILHDTEIERRTRMEIQSLLSPRANLSEINMNLVQQLKEQKTIEEYSHLKNLIGMPMSKISQSLLQPQDMDEINIKSRPLMPTSRQLQGKKLGEWKNTRHWFYVPQKEPPSRKWKNFQFVLSQIDKYWNLFPGSDEIPVRELFKFENDFNTVNCVALVRVLEKLSLRKEILLIFKNGQPFVTPFKYPFVSEKQAAISEVRLSILEGNYKKNGSQS